MSPQQGSLAYSRDRLVTLKDSINAEIASLGGHLGLSRLVEGFDRQLEGLELAATPASSESGNQEGGTGTQSRSGSIGTSDVKGRTRLTLQSL